MKLFNLLTINFFKETCIKYASITFYLADRIHLDMFPPNGAVLKIYQ